jgi:hypothetical protein
MKLYQLKVCVLVEGTAVYKAKQIAIICLRLSRFWFMDFQ